MGLSSTFLAVTRSDLRLIFRDAALRGFLFAPIILILVVRIGFPALVEALPFARPYIAILLMGASIQLSLMFGFIYAMTLIQEKELEVNKVYGVMPMSRWRFICGRFLVPVMLSAVSCFAILWLQPFYPTQPRSLIPVSLGCGLLTPLISMTVAGLSKDRVSGMTWFKLVNIVVTLPLIGFFVPSAADYFAFIPSHWIFQTTMFLAASVPFPPLMGYFVPHYLLIGVLLYRWFVRKQYASG